MHLHIMSMTSLLPSHSTPSAICYDRSGTSWNIGARKSAAETHRMFSVHTTPQKILTNTGHFGFLLKENWIIRSRKSHDYVEAIVYKKLGFKMFSVRMKLACVAAGRVTKTPV